MYPHYAINTIFDIHTIRHLHHSSYTMLIHSLQASKPSQYSLICTARQRHFFSSSSTHLLIPNSTYSWHSHLTPQTRHFENIHFLFLITSHSPPIPLLSTTPLLLKLLLHMDTSSNLSTLLYCSACFSMFPMLYTAHSFSVYHISFTSSAATLDPRYLKQSPILADCLWHCLSLICGNTV